MLRFTPRSLRAALLLVLGTALAACSDQSPIEPVHATAQSQVRSDLTTSTLLPLVQWNTPRATAATSSHNVGILGATIVTGGVTLVIPPLALTKTTTITMTVPAGKYVMVELQPHGLTFGVQPLLLFPILGTDAGLLGLTNLIGVYTTSTPQDGLISVDESYSMSLIGTLLGFHIKHFSDYAPARKGLILMGG